MSEACTAVAARFPFGRYAATPWYRARREHLHNVEWPPSPWRMARALINSAYSLGGRSLAEETAALVRHLATVRPHYRLPPAGEIVYTQWMPGLRFDDSPGARDRTENGHTLVAVAPRRRLIIWWPELTLQQPERSLMARLLDNVRHLGQSVSVCELTALDEMPAPCLDEATAKPIDRSLSTKSPKSSEQVRRVALLVPDPSITLEQLCASTHDGLLKAMPAPPGAHWVEYALVEQRRPSAPQRAHVRGVVYRLDGNQRPGVPGPLHPEPPAIRGEGPSLIQLLHRAWRRAPALTDAPLALDDDGDGRAERIAVRLATAMPTDQLGWLLEPARLRGPSIDCMLRVESISWQGTHTRRPESRARVRLIAFTVRSVRRPLLSDAVVLGDVFRRRLLGVAGRRLGADALPERLSGRSPDGTPLRDDHAHSHFLAVARDEREIDYFAIWCDAGLTTAEAALVRATTLPALCGAPIELVHTDDDRLTGPARVWRSHTPFLPVRHPKRRRGVIVHSPQDQVVEELARRNLPRPLHVEAVPGPWASFRLLRRSKPGCSPGLGAHGFAIEFAEEVSGPISLGRNSHFGMGLFLPDRR
jgi:hypothetical protein